MPKISLPIVLCVLFTLAYAQKPTHEEKSAARIATEERAAADKRSYGMQFLKISEAEAGGLAGGMRAWALLQVARGYVRFDKTKAIELLEEALAATRNLVEERLDEPSLAVSMAMGHSMGTRARLQEQILREMVPLAPEKADRLLEQVDATGRETVLNSLLAYYEKKKMTERTREVISRISAEREMPYGAALRLMEQMKPEQSGELTQLFASSFVSYRKHAPHDSLADSGGVDFANVDFANMVARFWTRLPRQLVREAIDEILKQADPANESDGIKVSNLAVASDKGAAAFSSLYEYRLFQLLPALEQIDSSAAGEYLKKYRNVAGMLQKYPDGEQSISRGESNDSAGNGLSASLGGGAGSILVKTLEFPQAQEAAARAGAGHYAEAMSAAASVGDASLRAACYEAIARTAMKKDAEISKKAVENMVDAAETLEVRERVRYYRAAAEVYAELAETQAARSMIEKGLADAKKLYQRDANPDDPNKALKAFWPATDAYCSLLRLAGRISPPWTFALLKQISDPEIKVAAETALAGEWLGVPPGQSFVMTMTKSGARTTIGAQ
jgi:hypothetical protein